MIKHNDKQINDKFLKRLDQAAGVDIHKDKINMCIMKKGKSIEQREYGTVTEELEKIRDELKGQAIEECAMESTGVYWCGLYNILTEAGIKVTLSNPWQTRHIPGRKTDVLDSQWLSMLLSNGLIRGSYVPEQVLQELRDLTRQRTRYVDNRSRVGNQMIKVLERSNIKLRSVLSNILSVTGMSIIRAIAEGKDEPAYLLSLCKGKIRRKLPQVEKALKGRVTRHDREMLQMLLEDFDHYDNQIKRLDEKTDSLVESHPAIKSVVKKIDDINGVGLQGAMVVVSELGTDLSRFDNASQCASYGGLAPGNNESAGKKKRGRARPGNKYLRRVVVQQTWVLVRKPHTYWWALYKSLRKNMPKKKALIAVARRFLELLYKLIKYGEVDYQEWTDEQYYQKRKLGLRRVGAELASA